MVAVYSPAGTDAAHAEQKKNDALLAMRRCGAAREAQLTRRMMLNLIDTLIDADLVPPMVLPMAEPRDAGADVAASACRRCAWGALMMTGLDQDSSGLAQPPPAVPPVAKSLIKSRSEAQPPPGGPPVAKSLIELRPEAQPPPGGPPVVESLIESVESLIESRPEAQPPAGGLSAAKSLI